MIKGATGPLTSALPLFAVPLIGAVSLPSGQFAMWSILASISTMALSLDFGGPAYLAARLDPQTRSKPFVAATAMTTVGTAAVGLLSLVAWVPFSRTEAASSFSFVDGAWAIAAITCGSALRSVVQLEAQVALFDRRFALRNTILLTHSVTALAVVLIALPATQTAWALPIAWFAAGFAGILVGAIALRAPEKSTHDDWRIETSRVAPGGTYVWARTLANALRAILLQADRWIVGAVGGPVVLATYEVAWRVAALPRFLAENLTFIIGLDAARVRASTPDEVGAQVSYSIRFSLIVLGIMSTVAAAAYALLPNVTGLHIAWATFVLLMISHAAVATAAPISFVGNGIGIPTIDLPYLSVSVGISIASAVVAYLAGDVYVFICGTTAALVIGNVWFWRYGLAAIRRATAGDVGRVR